MHYITLTPTLSGIDTPTIVDFGCLQLDYTGFKTVVHADYIEHTTIIKLLTFSEN